VTKECTLAEKILTGMRSILGDDSVNLHEPSFLGNESRYVEECLRSTNVASEGQFVSQFESMLAEYTGAQHVIAVSSGTAALHVALLLVGVSRDDEVLVPDLSFIATANSVAYCSAIPHFVDVEEEHCGIRVPKLQEYLESCSTQEDGVCVNRQTGRRIKAIIPMHAFGHPVDMDSLLEVAEKFSLDVVEDAAEALGSFYKGRHAGTLGHVGVLSFNGNKIITTGGGGALLTDDPELAANARHITRTAKLPHRWEYIHDQVGYNYRLPNLNAAIGVAQMEKLPLFLDRKRSLFAAYAKVIAPIQGVKLICESQDCRSNYWLQTLILDQDFQHERDSILSTTNDAGFVTRPAWQSLSRSKPFRASPSMKDMQSVDLVNRLINLPSSSFLG